MAVTVGILAESGQGKTTSLVINPDGSCIYLNKEHPMYSEEYNGMNPETTVIINADGKSLPFKNDGKWKRGVNLIKTSDVDAIKKWISQLVKNGKKSIVIDTINAIMIDREMNDIKKKSYDKWADLAQDIYELITFCNTDLPDDIIVYFNGHVGIYTDTDGFESKCLITNGKKLEKIKLETKLPIVLFCSVTKGQNGTHIYQFETQASRSTAKSPIGMFTEFLIPNSLKLVDNSIREYYGI